MTASTDSASIHSLRLRRLGLDTQREHVIFIRADSLVCRSEGFTALTRVHVQLGARSLIATLQAVVTDLLHHDEASLSESAWHYLQAQVGDRIVVSHPEPVQSLRHVRSKIYGQPLAQADFLSILSDAIAGRYTDVELTAFLVACATAMSEGETVALTRAMVAAGERLDWGSGTVADKHCVGGLPGNRTTMLVVPILAAAGLRIPKTSSRAITSPAGTADTMETLAPVDLSIHDMRRVVEAHGGCIVWGGAVQLSPADDVLLRIERSLDIDTSAQLVASVLSKKKAAGSTHVLIDIPVGPTAKVRNPAAAHDLARLLHAVGHDLGLNLRILHSDGSQPVGRGIGPVLEALDVLQVLQNHAEAPDDLRARSLDIAAGLLELTGRSAPGTGWDLARQMLLSGAAWRKFQDICEAQGGMRVPQRAQQRVPVVAPQGGRVAVIDNRAVAKVAKLAGAPRAKAAGVEFLAPIGRLVQAGEPLFWIHADSQGELQYALDYVQEHPDMVRIEQP